MSKHQEMIDELGLREDDDLLFMASIIHLILDERGVYYPSRQSETKCEVDTNES